MELAENDIESQNNQLTNYDSGMNRCPNNIPVKNVIEKSNKHITDSCKRRRKMGSLMSKRDDSHLTVTVRSLRNTPGRLQARCERGRIASDSSSTSNSSGCFPSSRPSLSDGSDDA